METKIRIDTGLLLKFGLAIFGLVCLFWLATNSASAVPDYGNLTDANGNNALFFNDGGMVYINMTDGVTNGTTKASVNVTAKDMIGLDQIAVAVKDDGTGAPWDAPNDGIYWGKFSIRSDGGTSGAFTDDLADVLDMKNAQAFTVSANLDGLTANLTLTGTSDFVFPAVTNVIPVNDTVVKGNVVFKMTVTDLHRNDTRIGVTLPGDIPVYFDTSGTPDIFNKTVNTDTISQGNRTFTFFAVDQAGNNETFDIYIHIDRTIPSVVINQPQASAYVAGNMNLNVTVNDAHVNASSVVYKIDGGQPSRCLTPPVITTRPAWPPRP